MPAAGRRTAWRDAVLAASLAALFFSGLGRPELSDPDESRHAEIAREMVESGRFLTPTLNGEPYREKPVGFHWLVATSIAALGPTEVAARLPSALAALAAVMTTAWWAARLYGAAAARAAALILATNYFFLALGRFGGLDMTFAALLSGAVALVSVRAEQPSKSPRAASAIAHALVGFAVLVKGPAAIILVAPAWIVAATTRPEGWKRLAPVSGMAIVLGIALPWYLAAAAADPEYIASFLARHNAGRFLGDASLPHQSPLIYYAAALPLAALPWTPYWFAAVASHRRVSAARPGERVAVAWIAGVLLIFALARTRLITYYLPIFPALAVLTAGRLTSWQATAAESWCRRAARYSSVVASVISMAALAAATVSVRSIGPSLPAAATAGVATAYWICSFRALRGSCPPLGRSCIVIALSAVVAALSTYGPVAEMLTRAKGYRSLAATLEPALTPDTSVSRLSRAAYALSFYARRNVRTVANRDAARSELESPRPVFLITKKSHADTLVAQAGAELAVVWRNAQGASLVVNPSAAELWRRREGVEPSADLDGRHHGFEDRSGHRTRSLSTLGKGSLP